MHLGAIPLHMNGHPEAVSPIASISCLATLQVKILKHPRGVPFIKEF